MSEQEEIDVEEIVEQKPGKMLWCAVCGDKANGSRYGAPACLGCIVFFRRAVCKQAEYRCPKQQKCEITYESRCICRFCRFNKCLTVGMSPNAIQRRDVMGPRKKKVPPPPPAPDCWQAGASGTPSPYDGFLNSPGPSTSGCQLMVQLERLQRKQRANHMTTSAALDPELIWGEDLFKHVSEIIHRPPFRRARKRDVNFMMKVSLTDAAEWANQFSPFKQLGFAAKKAILAEYGVAFMLIDQGAVTARREDEDYWMLQNNTYMCPDYHRGLPEEDKYLKDVETKAKFHPDFVVDAILSVGCPMRQLGVDAFECVALKTVLLLSYKNQFGLEHEKAVTKLQNKVLKELHTYIQYKHPGHAERMGAVLLLISGIRCTTRSCHQQTMVSDVFQFMTFNSLIRDVYIES